jgi:hypothetical protein
LVPGTAALITHCPPLMVPPRATQSSAAAGLTPPSATTIATVATIATAHRPPCPLELHDNNRRSLFIEASPPGVCFAGAALGLDEIGFDKRNPR